jgi:tetratricopeptide (TPR) repeat protein
MLRVRCLNMLDSALAPRFQQYKHVPQQEVIAVSPLIRLFSLVCLATLASITAQAETGILWVKVLNLKNTPVRKVSVGAEGAGSSALTDDRGLAKIRLASRTMPGTWVTLEVSSDDYAFVSPWDRKVLIPPFRNGSENFVTVYLTARGDREALESGRFAVALAAKFNATLTPKLQKERTTEAERKVVLAEVVRSFGLTPEEADRAIHEWGKKAVNPYDKGVIAIYQQNYPEAMAQLTKSYDMRRPALEKAKAEMVEVTFSLGQSLYGQGMYYEAAEKLREANALRNDDASTINYLGIALFQAGEYTEAKEHLSWALDITEESLGVDHPLTATSLSNLAVLYCTLIERSKAEPFFKRALAIREKSLGVDHPDIAQSLDNLAGFYCDYSQRKYAEAEPLYKRSLAIRENVLGADHPETVRSLNNLKHLYNSQRKYAEAEPLYKRTLAITEKSFGADHPETARSLGDLAANYEAQGKYAEAETLHKRALAIIEKVFGVDHPETAVTLFAQAGHYRTQGKYAEAEAFYKRALAIWEKDKAADNIFIPISLGDLADIYKAQGKYDEAEAFYKRALALWEKISGADDQDIVPFLNKLAGLYYSQGKYAEAEPLYKRALAIREKFFAAAHPETASARDNLAELYSAQGKYAEAEPLYKRNLEIAEMMLYPGHGPFTNFAMAIAETLYSRGPNVAHFFENYAKLLRKMNREAEAVKLEARAKEIRAKAGNK